MWNQGKRDQAPLIETILKANEPSMMMAVEYFRTHPHRIEDFWFTLRGDLVLTTPDGRICPCFPQNSLPSPFPPKLVRRLAKGRALIGPTRWGIILQPYLKGSLIQHKSFILMAYKGAPLPQGEPPLVKEAQRDCSSLKSLFPLQLAYEKEEVRLEGYQYSDRQSLENLKKSLMRHHHGVITLNRTIVAKGNTNSLGWEWNQLGGIYTSPAYRNRGYGSQITAYLIKRGLEEGKKTILFVGTQNFQALRVYEKLNFQKDDNYSISYYH